jgi:DUF4097 and DUF4098 domain-containing protein YvlB
MRDFTRRAMLPFALALAATPAAARQTDDDDWVRRCERDDGWGRDRVRHCEVRVERVRAGGGRLEIDGHRNGGVTVRGWDRSEIEVHARIRTNAATRAEARALASRITVEVRPERVSAGGPATGRAESWSVSFVVYVPQETDLTANTHNGPIGVAGVSGSIDVRTQNGPVTLRDVAGDVRARTQNGPLTVELSGTHWDGVGLDARTRNGPVRLILPESYDAELEAGTLRGPFRVDFPLTVTLGPGSRAGRFTTTLGRGGAPVRVTTENGPVTIRRP